MKRRGLQGSLKTSLEVQMIKNLLAIQETRVRSLGPDDALERKFSSILWRIPWTEEPGGLQSMESPSVSHEGLMLSLELESNCLSLYTLSHPELSYVTDKLLHLYVREFPLWWSANNHNIQLLGLLWDKYKPLISSGLTLANFALTALEGFEEWSRGSVGFQGL